MNKSELVEIIAENAKLTKKNAESALNAFVETVKDELAKGGKISLVGFGTFEVRNRAAREGKNPRTKEIIKIAACKVPAFKSGKALKEKVNG